MSISPTKPIFIPGEYSSPINTVYRAQSPMAQAQDFIPLQEASEDSLVGGCLSNVAIFGGIKSIPYVRHPNSTWRALQSTKDLFENTAEFEKLTASQQAEAFSKLFSSRQQNTALIKKLKGHNRLSKGYSEAINTARNNYINALKAGDEVAIAQHGAELSRLSKGKAGIWPFGKPDSLKKVQAAATKEGAEAVKVINETKALKASVESASWGKKAWAFSKDAFKKNGGWWAVGLEAAFQAPEVIGAFSEGGFGEGVKQTAKSTVTVGVNTVGWIAGMKAGAAGGTALGAKIGALIGSVVAPGAGTAAGAGIGGAIGGFIGGLVGMATGTWAAGKVSKAIVGKSFSEKKAELAKLPKAIPAYENPFANPQTQQIEQSSTSDINPFSTDNRFYFDYCGR